MRKELQTISANSRQSGTGLLRSILGLLTFQCLLSVAAAQSNLFVSFWRWDCGSSEVTIEFTQNLDPNAAQNPANYSFSPQGNVLGVTFNPPNNVVELTVSGLSTVGWNTLTLSNIVSDTGEPLDPGYTQVVLYCHDHPMPNEAPLIDCPADVMIDCVAAPGLPQSLSVNVSDADGDPLTVTWYVDGQQVFSENFAAGPAPNSQTSTLNHFFPTG